MSRSLTSAPERSDARDGRRCVLRTKKEKDPPESEKIVATILDVFGQGARGTSSEGEPELLPCPQPGLFHTRAGEAWGRVPVGEHIECHAVRSPTFRQLLLRVYYQRTGSVPAEKEIKQALNELEAQARFASPEEEVFLRLAGDKSRIVIDLGDTKWRSVVVTARGVRVLDHHPVAFRRSATMLPLPEPELGHPIDPKTIHPALDEEVWPLVAAWLVGCLRPWQGAYAILSLVGEAGSGKTGLANRLASVTDPAEALRAPPKNERDVAAAALHAHLLGYDNFSSIPAWLSDCLCRLVTGTRFAGRKLYSDADEHQVVARRPVIVTSIPDVVVEADLRDRSLVARLPQLPAQKREEDEVLAKQWDTTIRPRVFGSVLTALATGLRRLPSVHLAEKLRMLDHLRWAVACAPALGITEEAMVRAHVAERNEGAAEAVTDSPVGQAIMRMLRDVGLWEGTAGQLARTLVTVTTAEQRRAGDWPRTPRGMGGAVRRLAPDLRRLGVTIEFTRHGHKKERVIRMAMIDRPHRPHRPASSAQEANGQAGQATGVGA